MKITEPHIYSLYDNIKKNTIAIYPSKSTESLYSLAAFDGKLFQLRESNHHYQWPLKEAGHAGFTIRQLNGFIRIKKGTVFFDFQTEKEGEVINSTKHWTTIKYTNITCKLPTVDACLQLYNWKKEAAITYFKY